MMRRNHWVTDKVAMASWRIALPEPSPELEQAIRDAGAATEVFVAPGDRATALAKTRPSGRVAYFDRDGSVQEELVSDLGALILRLEEPGGLDRNSLPKPPLTITAFLPEEILISLYTDIWFPALIGLAETGFSERIEARDLYDNAALAGRHTRRLNEFLATIRAAALAAGGIWELDDDPDPIYETYFEMCDEHGVRL